MPATIPPEPDARPLAPGDASFGAAAGGPGAAPAGADPVVVSDAPAVADDEIDRRIALVLEVLAGTPVADVAVDHGLEPHVLDRWLDLFLSGGRDRLLGRVTTDVESRDRFLALTAHEFLTPLTIIGGWAQMLSGRTGELDPELVEQGVDAIARQSASLERIARDVLDSASVALGRFRLLLADVDVRRLAVEAAATIETIPVAVEPGSRLVVRADPQRLHQVVTQLLANAAGHPGATALSVSVARGRSAGGDEAVVRIRSDGTLDLAMATTLFEPWTPRPRSGRAGIGLYACRALVVAHGGTLGVRGAAEGTELWLRLPVGGPAAGVLVGEAEDVVDGEV